MVKITSLEEYSGPNENKIIFSGKVDENIRIIFRGKNNTLRIAPTAKIRQLFVDFDCDNGTFEIGGSLVATIRVNSRVGQDSSIIIGDNCSMTGNTYFSAVEGAKIAIGRDAMFASGVQIRSDDAHPIFDVPTGKRINPAKDITVGEHVWLGNGVTVYGGAQVGNGTVLGSGAVVKSEIPNNCIAVGAPARVVRRDVAWERPHLSLARPYYKPDADSIRKSEYWNVTYPPLPAEVPEVVELALPFEKRAIRALQWRAARLVKVMKAEIAKNKP